MLTVHLPFGSDRVGVFVANALSDSGSLVEGVSVTSPVKVSIVHLMTELRRISQQTVPEGEELQVAGEPDQ